MERNLPAAPEERAADVTDRRPLEGQRPLSVAYLPIALVTFMTLAFIIAAWTFLATAV